MDTSLLLRRRKQIGHYASHIFPVLVALTAGPGMLKAGNLLATFASNGTTSISSVTLNCSTLTGTPPSATIIVKASPALVSPNQLIVSGALSGSGAANFVLTAPGSQTLTSTVTTLSYTVTLAATPLVGCQGLSSTTTATVTFSRIAGTSSAPNAGATPTADITTAVTTTVNGGSSVASALSVSAATVNLTCVLSGSTYYPGPPQTVTVGSSATGGTPFALDSNAPAAAWVTYPTPIGANSVASGSGSISFTVQAASTCDSLPVTSGNNTATSTISLASTLLGSGVTVADKTITVNLTVSGPSASSLVVNPTSITITCSKNGSVYTPNYPQTASVTAPTSTPFTINTSGSASWLSVTATTTPTATSAIPALLAVTSGTNCGGGNVGTSNVTNFHLSVPGVSDKVVSVTGLIVNPTILKASPAAPSLTYVKGSGTAGYVDVTISSTSSSVPNPFFSVNTATLPSWLRLDSSTGTAPQNLRFSSTSVADTIAPGTYTASVVLSVSGYGDLNITVTMLLTNKAPQLTVQAPPSSEACTPASATTFCIPWVIGQALPTPTITAISTDTPIAYTATTGGLLSPVIAAGEQSGLAYSFGTPISLSFSPQAFASAQPGNTLTGTMTLTWGSPVSTVVITFQISVQSPGATITSFSPSTLPVESAGGVPYTVTLTGTGFVPSTDPTQTTRVGVVTTSGQPMTFDTNIHVTVVNQSNITLSITIPSAADPIPFAGGAFTLGVCNPVGGTCSTATSVAPLTIGNNPIVQAVTSSSSLLQNSTVSVAPFDMVSIFGTNFCPNCTSTQVLTGSPDPVTMTYPVALPFNNTTSSLSVTFQAHSGTVTGLPASAPMLFATNGQINLMVPSAVANASGPVDIVVNYGPAGSLRSSAPFTVSIVASDPGIFTIGADGQGGGAALDLNYNLISSTNPAGIRSVSSTSDIVSLYMTGLGAPDSLGDNTAPTSDGGYVWSADCVTLASYLTSFNNAQTGTALTSLDGTLITPSVLNTGRMQPCMVAADIPHVYIGGVDGVVKYAGWVAGTIAGLYQINVQLPINAAGTFTTAAGLTNQSVTAPIQLPVRVVTSTGQSQAGVTLWVAPRLVMTGPSSGTGPNTVGATVGVPIVTDVTNQIQASGGTGNVTFAVTSGLLPSGLSLSPSGQLSGIPAANTEGNFTVTVTATDSANIPVTGTSTFVVTVGNGLFMTTSTPTVSTFGTANAAVATVTASGGVYPYTYSIAIASHALPTGMTINPATGVISTTSATPAGSYLVVVSAQDSTSGTPLTGSSTFTVVVNLNVVATPTGSFTVTGQTSGAYNTIATTGQTGSVTYSLDSATTALVTANSSWLSFSNGIFTITGTASVAGTYNVTILATDGTAPADASAAGTGHTVNFTIVIGS